MKLPTLFSRCSLSQPQPAPIKRRRRTFGTFSGPIHPQPLSPFLSRLPAEIRNEIYLHVFLVDPPFSTSPWHPTHILAHHPLSLLLTCRLVNSEASVLAFRVYTFHVSGDISFHGLRLRTTCLPDVLFDAITSVSCMPWPKYKRVMYKNLEVRVLAEMLVLMPGIREVNVKAYGEGRQTEEWIRGAVEGIVECQRGRWRVVEDGGGVEGSGEEAKASVHVVEDEESGRSVRVMFERGGRVDVDCPGINWEHPGLGRFFFLLKEGVRRNENVKEVTCKSGKTGFEYDPGDEYWADLRNRRIYERKGEVDRGRDEELPGY